MVKKGLSLDGFFNFANGVLDLKAKSNAIDASMRVPPEPVPVHNPNSNNDGSKNNLLIVIGGSVAALGLIAFMVRS